jgi:hypothetical protein
MSEQSGRPATTRLGPIILMPGKPATGRLFLAQQRYGPLLTSLGGIPVTSRRIVLHYTKHHPNITHKTLPHNEEVGREEGRSKEASMQVDLRGISVGVFGGRFVVW